MTEKSPVSKSPFVIAVIGALGCLAMVLMLQHVVGLQGERSPQAVLLEQAFGDRLAGPVEVWNSIAGENITRTARAKAKHGVDLAKLCADMGEHWRLACPIGSRARLEIELVSEDGGAPVKWVVPDSLPAGR